MRKYLLLLLLIPVACLSPGQDYIYKATTIRAAPGKLLELIELIKEDMTRHETYGMQESFLMRHSQGDQWDLLLMTPVGTNLSTYFLEENVRKRQRSHTQSQPYGSKFYDLVSFHEELFVAGPPLEAFYQKFKTFDYYHVEMFQALAGKQKELLQEREMENHYLKEISREENHIFTRIMGGEVDIFTIGYYRDIKHYAESADIPLEEEDRAAKAAGFKGVNYIGSYLRSLIREHHDTLAGAVRAN